MHHAHFLKSWDELHCDACDVLNINLVAWQILDNGFAYRVDRDVYFSVDKFPEYGQLSGRKLEDNRAGERVAVDSRKKNPADFALWKVSLEEFGIALCTHNIKLLEITASTRLLANYFVKWLAC